MKKWCSSRIRSFGNAFTGIGYNLLKESNFRIHSLIAVLVVVAGLFFSIERTEWIIVVLVIGAVLSAEAMNTSIEKLCDRFLQKNDAGVKVIKDSAAAAVLILSLAAFVIGVLIFLPYVIDFFQRLNN